MKTLTLFSSSLLLAAAMPRVSAVEQLIVGWDQTWNYFQPMGAATDPAIADPTWNTTWFTTGVSFGAASTGIAGDATTFDRGTGDGPFGYDVIDYMTSGAPEFSSFGQTLTQPASGSRGAAYFRTTFLTPPNATPWSNIRIRMCLDDGALIYLDGVLIARVNKANNTEAWNAFATDTTATFNETPASANDEAVIQSFVLNATGTSTTAESTVVVPVLTLAGGSSHILAVSTRNNNFTSSDMCFAMELRADDTPPPFISAAATNVQRQLNGAGFADDTFSFDVVVSQFNFAGGTWDQTTLLTGGATGPASGAYGATVTYSGFPAQLDVTTLGTASLNFTNASPALSVPLTVTAPPPPPGAPLVLAPATPIQVADFEEDAIGNTSRVRSLYSTNSMGFTGNGAVFDDLTINAINGGTKALNFVGVSQNMTTEAVGLDPSVKGVKASLIIRTATTSGTSFESNDALRVALEGSADGLAWHELGDIVPLLQGNTAAGEGGWPANPEGIDQLINKIGPGAAGGAAPVAAGTYATLLRGTIAPQAGDVFIRVQVIQPPPPDGVTAAAALSGSENIIIDNITLEIGTDPSADPDGDGFNNGAEDFAGTNPASSASRPGTAFSIMPTIGVPGSYTVSATTAEGNFRAYVLQASDDLAVWNTVGYYFGTSAGGTVNQSFDSTTSRNFFRQLVRY